MDVETTQLPHGRPPNLYFAMTGETFEFQTSSRTGDGLFRFRWTLAAGKKGPPEHVHDDEVETFSVVSGGLRIWLDGVSHDLKPGESVAVSTGVRHRFHNVGHDAVVVNVSLNGPRQEDVLVPLAMHCGGRQKMSVGDVFVMIVHAGHVRASHPPSAAVEAMLSGMSRVVQWFGVRPLPTHGAW